MPKKNKSFFILLNDYGEIIKFDNIKSVLKHVEDTVINAEGVSIFECINEFNLIESVVVSLNKVENK